VSAALARLDRESAASQDAKLELKLWLRLLTCTSLIEREVRARLRARFGTTLPRFDLLAALHRTAEGLTMGELSSHLMVTNGNVTGLVDSLVRDGFVERAADPGDRRRLTIRLTQAGRRDFAAMAAAHERWIDELFAGLGRQDMARLQDLLGRLKHSVRSDA
jgi:DNA-binding MarR family transcriptional regulator